MTTGMGCDIVRIARLKKWLFNESLLRYCFTHSEIHSLHFDPRYVDMHSECAQRATEQLAGIFAAKEAFKKAAGVRSTIRIKDIVVEKDTYGAPRLLLRRSAEKAMASCGARYAHLSIAHEKKYCIAVVIIGR